MPKDSPELKSNNPQDNMSKSISDIINDAINKLYDIKNIIFSKYNDMNNRINPNIINNLSDASNNLNMIKDFISNIDKNQENESIKSDAFSNIVNSLSSTIDNLKNINDSLSNENNEQQNSLSSNNSSGFADIITITRVLLSDLNIIKEELIKLFLNPEQKVYYQTCIEPLLNILYNLSTVSLNLTTSVSSLASSSILSAKHSKLKDTLDLAYCINDECEDVYKALKKRIDFIIKC